MYEEFFGLREAPFSLTPNTHFFMQSCSHAQALEMLLVGLRTGEGFLKVTGEVGTGKTLICRMLLNSIEDEYVTAYIPNPSCSPETLYCLLADELAGRSEKTLETHMTHHIDAYFNDSMTNETQMRALQQIQEKLLALAAQDQPVALIIDEAQAMSHETIEALRLISNLETESKKLLQIVLFGQPELDDRLAQDSLRQLAQRISFHHRLTPLSDDAVVDYVSHRIHQAGGDDAELFSQSALRLCANASMGVPRLINMLCHKAMILSYGQGLKTIEKEQMLAAVTDTPICKQPRFSVKRKPISRRWIALLLALPIGGVWVMQSSGLLL